MKTDRRKFIRQSLLATTATAVSPLISYGKYSSSEKLNVGLIGCNREGITILTTFLSQKNVECTALYDADKNLLLKTGAKINQLQQKSPQLCQESRQLIDNKSVNIVIDASNTSGFSTAVLASEAGKNVYLTTNLKHQLADYQLLINSQKKHDKIIQLNWWQMNAPHWKAAQNYIQSGSFDVQKVHVWDYSGGLIKGSSNFLMGYALEGLDKNAPLSALTTMLKNGDNIPETMMTVFDMEGISLLWDHSINDTQPPYGKTMGIAFENYKNTILVHPNGSEIISNAPEHRKEKSNSLVVFNANENIQHRHIIDFLISVKTRTTPISGIETAAKVALSLKMADVSRQLGQKAFLNNILHV